MKSDIEILLELFKQRFGSRKAGIFPLPLSGSNRRYYRVVSGEFSAIGTVNSDNRENRAFLYLAKIFGELELPVPEIYSVNERGGVYLQQDLGKNCLFDFLPGDGTVPEIAYEHYKSALKILPRFQIETGKLIDYSVCYPRAAFDEQSIQWDLNYFKYYFLKLAGIDFDEQKLEDDFVLFIEHLLRADISHFLYRDFQARNILIYEGAPYFIDFQGGRRGACEYDVASLLYQTKANLPQTVRDELLEVYLNAAGKFEGFDRGSFQKHFPAYILIRLLQTMGAYGFRGFYERKHHFLSSIPFAQKTLSEILPRLGFLENLPELKRTLKAIAESDQLRKFHHSNPDGKLRVRITSFSYKQGIPADYTGNGGGFVFDCRSIHNPGRYREYKSLTGKDQSVIEFIEQKSGAAEFLSNVYSLVDSAVNEYTARGFSNLMVNFGCTGGQHRSVYCAEKIAARISANPECEVELTHIELTKRGMR